GDVPERGAIGAPELARGVVDAHPRSVAAREPRDRVGARLHLVLRSDGVLDVDDDRIRLALLRDLEELGAGGRHEQPGAGDHGRDVGARHVLQPIEAHRTPSGAGYARGMASAMMLTPLVLLMLLAGVLAIA